MNIMKVSALDESGPRHRVNHEIQVLRAVAVLAVIVHHLVGLFVWDVPRWSQVGQGLYVGVDLFFCVLVL